MYDFFQTLELHPDDYKGQFILSKTENNIPARWTKHKKKDWYLGVNGLPVVPIVTNNGTDFGWCIGHPLNHQDPWAEKMVIKSPKLDTLEMTCFDKFYDNIGGRFIIIILCQNEEKLFLDPYGSLSAVYSNREYTVASTPSFFNRIHDWDYELINALKFPQRFTYFPLGLTSRKGVKRLIPNHYLDLQSWKTTRHWPNAHTYTSSQIDDQESISTIISCIKGNINHIAERYPIQFPLTAGRDSRVILACARDHMEDAIYYTFAENNETIDTYISSRLSERLNLNHIIIPLERATNEEMHRWLSITGHTVGGEILKLHKSLNHLEPERVWFNGIAGELGKGFYWRNGDTADKKITTDELLKRCGYSSIGRLKNEMEQWISGLTTRNLFHVLDLAYIELRLACWAAPQHYGNQRSLFEISPYNQRKNFTTTMGLSIEYRKRRRQAVDICNQLWPELLELPFNEFIGLKNHLHKSKNYLIRKQKDSVRSIKKLVKNIIHL